MKFIYVLEDDERSQKDLFDCLKSIDPQLHIRFFPNIELFHHFLADGLLRGAEALAAHGLKIEEDSSIDPPPSKDHTLRLVIAKYELFGKKNVGLIKRARDFFIRKKICSTEEPTALIFTAFDSPDFDISLAEERIVNNVIFKPFDKLILKLHLEYALTGHHPHSSETVVATQISTTIEMLKEIPLTTLSEIGFQTLNNHEIEIGAFTKYYSDSFKTDEKRSVFAFCTACEKQSDTDYLCDFRFFGLDNKQISYIRRTILQNKTHQSIEVLQKSKETMRIVILDENQEQGEDIQRFLLEKLLNVEVYNYTSVGQFQSDLSDKDTTHRQTLPNTFDIVIANYDLFFVEQRKKWDQILTALNERKKLKEIVSDANPHLFLLSRTKLHVDELKVMGEWCRDILFLPLDKTYFLKSFLSKNPLLSNQNGFPLAQTTQAEPLKVANPVQITEMSEGGLILKYYREMSLGAFRDFILWRPQELETPEIMGAVNYVEKDKSNPELFLNHFVFFGMRDHYLKHIRLWMRETYIKTKEKD